MAARRVLAASTKRVKRSPEAMDAAATVRDILFAMRTAGGLDATLATGAFGDLTADTAEAVVAEAARFAGEVLAPLNRVGDRAGVSLEAGRVTMAPGFAEAYRRWSTAGWSGIGAPVAWGGQGMPVTVQIAVQEIWNAANAAFATGPMLTAGAIEALAAHADEALKRRLIPQLVAGAWSATMNLTEPQAGSDLGAIRTRATRAADGSYRIFGQKIFITFGEHDMTANIVHMVLARLPDAPAGTRGISMFAVPKILDDGSHNDVVAVGIEEKLGLHGAPTCTMVYGERGEGAVGWRVGEENKGLASMFTMMNMARLSVGVQGVGVAAAATARALAYARERRQGYAPGAGRERASLIADHPDVRRMLLHMTTLTAAARAICHTDGPRHRHEPRRAHCRARRLGEPGGASHADRQGVHHRCRHRGRQPRHPGSWRRRLHRRDGRRPGASRRPGLRHLRGHQRHPGDDLVTRKLPLAGGAPIAAVIADVRLTAERIAADNRPGFGATAERLSAAADDLAGATDMLAAALRADRMSDALAGATPYLRLAAIAFGGALLAEAALVPGDGDDGRRAIARQFSESFVGETAHLGQIVARGGDGLTTAAGLLLGGKA